MYFENLNALIHMAGHGLYVWLSYGVTVLVLVGFIAQTYLKQRQFFKKQVALLKSKAHMAEHALNK